MKILAIDTATDETSVSVTEGVKILSNIVWSQASLHTKWGGVVPSIAQREHKKRIDFVIKKALGTRHQALVGIDAIAVTIGPGLSIALGVGVDKAKELAQKFKKPLIAVNHLEGHLLSPFARPKSSASYKLPATSYPSLGLVISGGNTILVKINKIGSYEILAQTRDDALGEALDKAARMLGLGYPGGAVLERFAKEGNPKTYLLPLPMATSKEPAFSYSGLKTAMYRLVEKVSTKGGSASGPEGALTRQNIYDLAACFQNRAFQHLIRVLRLVLASDYSLVSSALFVGGGVAANNEIRKRLRKMGKELGIKVWFPYSKKLCGDNAAMIGVAAYFKSLRGETEKDIDYVDRQPRAKITYG